MSDYILHVGDALEVLRTMADASVDSIVTDPPYGLTFMGKRWDVDVPSVDIWRECLRVLKPGGHLLAFAGTRTQHRMASRIEDAGFEIRDLIAWVYGSGFPKSLDVSKAIDKAAGVEREVVGQDTKARSTSGASALPTMGGETVYQSWDITAPATDAARQWNGWGTALKPALEPVTVARKPLPGTVAENVLRHGTGALNIDGCRVGNEGGTKGSDYAKSGLFGIGGKANIEQLDAGRWPANLIHDGSEEVLRAFPDEDGQQGAITGADETFPRGDNGSAARFFYCAKASAEDRGPKNNHPTVKPTDLMRYLCRLVTPPGGVVLDPFTGSGSTGRAALLEGFRFVGVEIDPAYAEIARARSKGFTPGLTLFEVEG